MTLHRPVCFTAFWALVVRLNRTLAPPGPILNAPLAFLAVSAGSPGEVVWRSLDSRSRSTRPSWTAIRSPGRSSIAPSTYNRHVWPENLQLAFEFPERVRIPNWRDDPEADLDP
jgi:hypothetical protein